MEIIYYGLTAMGGALLGVILMAILIASGRGEEQMRIIGLTDALKQQEEKNEKKYQQGYETGIEDGKMEERAWWEAKIEKKLNESNSENEFTALVYFAMKHRLEAINE